MFSVRIFRNSFVGHDFFKCCAMELVSERCIVSLLDKVVEVKATYEVHTISFQTFFVWAFKIGVDS